MVEVHLWSGLRALTGGAETVEVDARTIGDLLRGVAEKPPALADILEDQVSVSIDGHIYAGSLVQPIPDGAEVWLMQRLKGG